MAPIRNALAVMRLRGLDDPQMSWARDVIERQVGQLVRMVDIPATTGGRDIVEDPGTDAEGRPVPPGEFVRRLKKACATSYGTAGPAFVAGEFDAAGPAPTTLAQKSRSALIVVLLQKDDHGLALLRPRPEPLYQS